METSIVIDEVPTNAKFPEISLCLVKVTNKTTPIEEIISILNYCSKLHPFVIRLTNNDVVTHVFGFFIGNYIVIPVANFNNSEIEIYFLKHSTFEIFKLTKQNGDLENFYCIFLNIIDLGTIHDLKLSNANELFEKLYHLST
jgi:hypothetical protein